MSLMLLKMMRVESDCSAVNFYIWNRKTEGLLWMGFDELPVSPSMILKVCEVIRRTRIGF